MKKTINTTDAPAPIGPYNQAVLHKGTLYVSGQIAIDPQTNALETGSLEKETIRVMENLGAVLKSAGMDFGNVVKCSIFISDMDDFAEINAIYARYFPKESAPARETVEVSRLPKDVHVEISAIAME